MVAGIPDLFTKVLQSSLNLVPTASGLPLGDTAATLMNVTQKSGKIIERLSGFSPHPEAEGVYYNGIIAPDEEWRRPNFFSKSCVFRVSCEVGRLLLKPYSLPPVNLVVERSKLVHDLQNRYTRAATYGLLYGDCSKYYCDMLEFVGGPLRASGAVVELTNRLINPDLYE